ncbi:hypothetical protein BDQ12DRAFT_711861 [Crucibulum laeve]|uniref:NAD(P)-binding domain-containing protein n=1 Tax=Crucibulum laeve TaxID=68775 RepID=A0A5C3M4T9_9AGAR|nr:hypothetical protein BDQ12DRAFT_711861 [Crucibulum laeve]
MSASKSALILGATGQTGRALLQQLLASNDFTRVGEYGRRLTPAEQISNGKEKLEQKVIDFEKLEESGLRNGKWDVVFVTLGTTKKQAGSAENFVKIDRDYVINAARHAKWEDSEVPQRLVYVSAASAETNSYFLYTKTKGQTEEGLASLGYSDTIIFRPSMLQGAHREDSRLAETLFGKVTSVLSHFSSSIEIKIPTLAKAVYMAGKLGSDALPPAAQASKVNKEGISYTVIPNSGAIALAESSK